MMELGVRQQDTRWLQASPSVKGLRYPMVIILPATLNGSSLSTRCTAPVATEKKTGGVKCISQPYMQGWMSACQGLPGETASSAGQRHPVRWDAGQDKTPHALGSQIPGSDAWRRWFQADPIGVGTWDILTWVGVGAGAEVADAGPCAVSASHPVTYARRAHAELSVR